MPEDAWVDDCFEDDGFYGGEPEFCLCGVTLMGAPGENDGLCATCAAQPHPGRDSDGYPSCSCDECEAYWRNVCERSRIAADEWNRARAAALPGGQA